MKKIEQTTATITNQKNLELTEIKETPFKYATNGNINYVTCGNVLLETEMTLEEAKEWLDTKPWEAIALMTQRIYEVLKKQDKENKNEKN